MTPPPVRVTLRQFPLAARLTLTVFLLSVGLGYVSAMVQLHLQHSSKEGEPLPTVADVVEVFAGLKRADPSAPPPAVPVSKLERLVMGPVEGAPWNGSGSMAAAFFHKDGDDYKALVGQGKKAETDAEREGERLFVQAWIHAAPEAQSKAFGDDRLPVPEELAGRPVTAKYKTEDGGGVKVKTILLERCARCHAKGEAQENFPLQTYDHYLTYMDVPLDRPAPPAGWEWSDKQMGVEKLTQSTHAHLLSFAVLFALTGLTFAFTSYPGVVRGLVAPVVLLAQVADVSCWWLARVPTYGPYFAMAIIGTGTVVGLGLVVQILGGVFNMYGAKGKLVLAALFLAVLAAVGGTLVPKVASELDAQKKAAKKAKVEASQPKPDALPAPAPKPPEPKAPEPKAPPTSPAPPVPPAAGGTKPSRLEALVTGPWEGQPLKKGGTMVNAFFEKDGGDFKKELKDRGPALVAEREGEREAVRAWAKLGDAARRAAYDADKLPLPPDRAGQPVTPDYRAGGSDVKIKSILTDRCVRCHAADAEQEQFPLETYDQLRKYLDAK